MPHLVLSIFACEGDRNPSVSVYQNGIKLLWAIKEYCPTADLDDIIFYLNHSSSSESTSQRFDTATEEFLIIAICPTIDQPVRLS